MAGDDGCNGGSRKCLPIPAKAPPQAKDDGEEGKEKGETQHDGLPDEFYLVEAVRKKRVRKGEPQYLIKWVGWPETSNTWEPMENLASISDMIDEFEESLAQQKKLVPSPSPVVSKKKNVCDANKVGKTKECSKKMESPKPKELVVPKTKMGSEDKSLQSCEEAQSSVGLTTGGAKEKKKKRKSAPAKPKKFKFPKRSELLDLWNLGDDYFADMDLD